MATPQRRTDGRRTAPASEPRLFEATLEGRAGWGITLGDAVVVVATLLVAACAAAVLWFSSGLSPLSAASSGAVDPAGQDGAAEPAGQALYAVVQNTEGFYEVLDLGKDAEVEVSGSLGTNVIEVSGGSVRCAESDCSNQVCVDTGWVSEQGQMIVCLPHELTVQVVADPEEAVPLV